MSECVVRELWSAVDGEMSGEAANDIIKAFVVMYVQGMSHSTVLLQEFMKCAPIPAQSAVSSSNVYVST